jgi:hypothetical protein
MTYAFATVIGPRVFNVPASPPVAAHGLQVSQACLDEAESMYVSSAVGLQVAGCRLQVAGCRCDEHVCCHVLWAGAAALRQHQPT